ncbi:cupin domain-containing protein [soil metagenome]
MTTAATRTIAADALAEPLAREVVDAGDVVEGSPKTGSLTLDEAFGFEVGLWEITAGTVVDVEADEVFVVLYGRGSVRFEDGSIAELRPGTVMRLQGGDRTTWTIVETLRKVYVLLPPAH